MAKAQARAQPAPAAVPAQAPDACMLIIFGASGDLTRRKLVPALYRLAAEGHLPDRFAAVGFARRESSDDAFRKQMREAVNEHTRTKPVRDDVWNGFADGLHYVAGTFEDTARYAALKKRVEALEATRCP